MNFWKGAYCRTRAQGAQVGEALGAHYFELMLQNVENAAPASALLASVGFGQGVLLGPERCEQFARELPGPNGQRLWQRSVFIRAHDKAKADGDGDRPVLVVLKSQTQACAAFLCARWGESAQPPYGSVRCRKGEYRVPCHLALRLLEVSPTCQLTLNPHFTH